MKDDNKWKLNDGETNIYAIMEDMAFQRKFDDRTISFRKGDILVCRVQYIQYRTDIGLRNEYRIVEVLEHKEPPTQIKMFEE